MDEQAIKKVLYDHGVFFVAFKDDKAKVERDNIRLAKELCDLYRQELDAVIQRLKVLFWFDDDCKTAGTLVTGSVIYSEFEALTLKKAQSK